MNKLWIYDYESEIQFGFDTNIIYKHLDTLKINVVSNSLKQHCQCLKKTTQKLWTPIMTSSNGNISRLTGPLCGEFTSHRWIPLTKASDAERWCFLWSVPEQTVGVNNWDMVDLRCYRAHCHITVMVEFILHSDHSYLGTHYRGALVTLELDCTITNTLSDIHDLDHYLRGRLYNRDIIGYLYWGWDIRNLFGV